MNLQRRDEIRAIAEFPNDMHWAQEMRRAVAELLAHIDTLESMRSRLCDALGLPADSAPETVAEAVEARRVVVPEPTCDEWRVIAENARSADMVDFLAGAAAYGLWLREHSRAIPADRVLGEGEGLNKKIREAYMEGHFDGVQWSGQDEEDANKEADWQASSALHAIRANQGGAAT